MTLVIPGAAVIARARPRHCCRPFPWSWYAYRHGADEAARNLRRPSPRPGHHGRGDHRRGAGGEPATGDAARVRRDRDGGRSGPGVSRHGGAIRARWVVDTSGAGAAPHGRRPRARSRCEGDRWTVVSSHAEDEVAQVDPFTAVEIRLGRWWLPTESAVGG